MHHFEYKNNCLYCEQVKAEDLAGEFGTPLYVYSKRTLLDHFLKIKQAFAFLKPLICYSVKANSNLSLLKLLLDKGSGLDIVSGGELFRAKKADCPGEKIVYASVGKTVQEIKDAINYGILMFNVESEPELEKINAIAADMGKAVKVALRVNPDVDAKTHAYITTGRKETKFGISPAEAEKIFLKEEFYPACSISGIHIHIGSQIIQAAPFVRAIKRITAMIERLRSRGVEIDSLNIGGGLGIVYDKEKPQTAAEFAARVLPLLKDLKLKIILEPGRFIAGNSGILLTRVIYVKETPLKDFIIVDSGMNDLMRPSLYQAFHLIEPVTKHKVKKIKKSKFSDIVGPICESGDFLGRDRCLDVSQGDCLAVFGAGAYGFSMSSQYNSRPRAAEVLVEGKKARLIRKRETYKDLISKELF